MMGVAPIYLATFYTLFLKSAFIKSTQAKIMQNTITLHILIISWQLFFGNEESMISI